MGNPHGDKEDAGQGHHVPRDHYGFICYAAKFGGDEADSRHTDQGDCRTGNPIAFSFYKSVYFSRVM